MSGEGCDRSSIFALPFNDRCQFVTDHCTEDINAVNFNTFYFCNMHQHWILAILLGVFTVLLCFRVISTISDEYLSISLGNVSKRLGLSEALTGVTLLAYANGSPDIISGLVAGDQEGGALLSIGALYGASLFVCNIVFAAVLHSSPDRSRVMLPKSLFLRDVGVFFFSTTLLIFLGFSAISTLMVCILLITIYILYVMTVVAEEYFEKRKPQDNTKNDLERNFFRSATVVKSDAEGEDNIEGNGDTSNSKLGNSPSLQRSATKGSIISIAEDAPERHIRGKGLTKFFKSHRHKIEDECRNGNLMDKFFFIFEYPLKLVMNLTIPPGDQEEYLSVLGLIYPFTSVYMVMFVTQHSLLPTVNLLGTEVYLLALIFPLQVLISILIFCYTEDENPKLPMVMLLVSSAMSVCWIYMISNLIMDMLNLVQAVSGVSRVFLGLTLLSLGNSLGDLFVDTALAKQGFTTMAFTGIFSGQLLNLLIGFALNCLMSWISAKKHGKSTDFELFDAKFYQSKTQFLCFFVMAYSSLRLLSHIMSGIYFKNRLPKWLKYGGYSVYGLFVLLFVIFEFAVKFERK